MKEVSTIGLDLAKTVFEVHGADREGGVALHRTLRRNKVAAYFAKSPPCPIVMEACATAHLWARELPKPGHT